MTLKHKTIFLADDDEDDRMFFAMAVDSASKDISLVTFNDGEQLMHHLRDNVEQPDILFLDINMPRLSGLECLEKIRNSDKWKDMPVAMYSTSGSEIDIERSKELGAQAYVMKPFKLNILIEIVEWALKNEWQNTVLSDKGFFIEESNW